MHKLVTRTKIPCTPRAYVTHTHKRTHYTNALRTDFPQSLINAIRNGLPDNWQALFDAALAKYAPATNVCVYVCTHVQP